MLSAAQHTKPTNGMHSKQMIVNNEKGTAKALQTSAIAAIFDDE
jgi:hypothetical protein